MITPDEGRRPAPNPLSRRRVIAAGGALVLTGGCSTPAPAPVAVPPMPSITVGRLERTVDMPSKRVPARPVDVWLPPGYRPDGSHAVLYLHDGQMLWDPRRSWNGQAWNAHITAARLIAAGRVRPFILVGVWNRGDARHAEYFPAGILSRVNDRATLDALGTMGVPQRASSAAYLRFLAEELVPMVEARYGTSRDREHRFIAGSSMGGLISINALCEQPQVWGGAAGLSTHWIGSFQPNRAVPDAALAYLREKLPVAGRHRLYLDRGTAGLDALYEDAQLRVDALLEARDWKAPLFDTRVFPGADHTENDWAARLEVPLEHLLRA